MRLRSLEKRWVTNLRLVLTHRPGSDLFVVYNEERGSEAMPRAVVNRTLAVKLTWLLRF
jgi:hypothetical protein